MSDNQPHGVNDSTQSGRKGTSKRGKNRNQSTDIVPAQDIPVVPSNKANLLQIGRDDDIDDFQFSFNTDNTSDNEQQPSSIFNNNQEAAKPVEAPQSNDDDFLAQRRERQRLMREQLEKQSQQVTSPQVNTTSQNISSGPARPASSSSSSSSDDDDDDDSGSDSDVKLTFISKKDRKIVKSMEQQIEAQKAEEEALRLEEEKQRAASHTAISQGKKALDSSDKSKNSLPDDSDPIEDQMVAISEWRTREALRLIRDCQARMALLSVKSSAKSSSNDTSTSKNEFYTMAVGNDELTAEEIQRKKEERDKWASFDKDKRTMKQIRRDNRKYHRTRGRDGQYTETKQIQSTGEQRGSFYQGNERYEELAKRTKGYTSEEYYSKYTSKTQLKDKDSNNNKK